ncbi:hypothetical protein ACS0TY_014972 [Phlomoides rotata]
MNQERKALDAYQFAVCNGNKKMHRSNSEKLERIKHGVERRRELKRSKTERRAVVLPAAVITVVSP